MNNSNPVLEQEGGATAFKEMPELVALMKAQSTQLAVLTGELSSVGESLKEVILLCDVVLFKNAICTLVNKINSNVNIRSFSPLDEVKSSDLAGVAGKGLIVLLSQNSNGLEKMLGIVDYCSSFKTVFICTATQNISEAVNSGVDGIISLESDMSVMRSALIKVLKGERVREGVDTEKADMADQLCRKLTPRQKEVLECIRIGKCNKEIARDLDMSLSTVKVHCMAIYRVLGVSSRTQAAFLLS